MNHIYLKNGDVFDCWFRRQVRLAAYGHYMTSTPCRHFSSIRS